MIRIVLVETTHPGNIGAAARAMKTMALSRLYLVAPKIFPDQKASDRAVGADDILQQAVVVDSLEDALSGCQLIFASSARRRDLDIPGVSAAECGQLIAQNLAQSASSEIAVVFGQERTGLTNEQLLRCHYHIQIPTNPQFSSLNLAHAVQIIAYEIYIKQFVGEAVAVAKEEELANAEDVERFHTHLEEVLRAVKFLKPNNPGRVKQRLRRLFNRARLEVEELNILRGILTQIQRALRGSRD